MARTIEELELLLKDKNIALVGNSDKVIGKNYPVDDHDIVIRMNRAWQMPENMKKDIGYRTDLLSASIEQENIEKLVNDLPIVMWMTPKHRDAFSSEVSEKLVFYPVDWWEELQQCLGANPSTGCMTFDVIRRYIGDGSVTLYGFDFFKKSHNWYQKKKWSHKLKDFFGISYSRNPHSGDKEEQFIRHALPESQLFIEEL